MARQEAKNNQYKIDQLAPMKQLISLITNHHSLSDDSVAALQQSLTMITVPKNDHLLTEGKICRHLYFLEKGAIRGYYNADGKEITHWFGFENDFVTSFHSFITGTPAVENIQLLEGSVLWSISKDTLTGLLNQYPDIERLVRIIYEKYYIRLEERYVNAQFRSAKERYENLMAQTPHILERVSLGFIASYLGISQETLSRIRSKL